jgi:DNA-binding response OmpR family regulator
MPKSVLIIDDDEDLSALLKEFLQSKGFTVYRAPDGVSGVEKARALRPDIITLDFNMPGANGVETYNELHRSPETAVIPVVFFSSTLLGIIQRMILENPRVRFLKKTCTTQELGKCIDDMTALPKLAPPPPPPQKKPEEYS